MRPAQDTYLFRLDEVNCSISAGKIRAFVACFWYTRRVDIELDLTTVDRESLLGIGEQIARIA